VTSEPTPTSDPKRRNLLKAAAAGVIGAVLGVFPALAGLVTFCDPLRRKSGAQGWFPVAPLESLPEDGRPRLFKIICEQVDAWTRCPNMPVGAVYLRRVGPRQVQAFSAVCPHLGCMVETAESGFICPCHKSRFTADGAIDASAGGPVPSPRAMDTLEATLEETPEGTMVRVQYRKFRPGTAEKIPE
jgi:nitrite reductase/ring-hydroxylating ferredoxin subunit